MLPRHDRRLHPPSPCAQLCPAPLGRRFVDRPRRAVDHLSVIVTRGLDAHELVPDVTQHARGFALERVAPTAWAWLLVPEDIALLHRHRQLPRQLAVLSARVHEIAGGTARLASI